jgi:hypothetical protein
MIAALLPALVPILGDALKRLFPDAEARQRAEAELNAALLARAGELQKAAADIIKAEAQSEHWLFTKVPKVIDAFERGALIRAKGGRKFLAIPTGFNAARGRRGRGEKGMRVTPAQMVASGQAFLRPFKSGRGFVWCLPLRAGEQAGRRRRRLRLIAGSVAEIGTAHRRGREAWARGLLARGMVPMFLLLPQVKLTKRLDVKGAAERGLRRLPGRFVAAWAAEAGRPR